MNNQLSQAQLKELLHYEPETGFFTWRVAKGRRVHVGDRAGGLNGGTGYWIIRINGKSYLAHRLAWLHEFGRFPDADLDHKNGIKSDCRITNLRLATESQNGANSRLHRDNRSGFKGVRWYIKGTKNSPLVSCFEEKTRT